ncbi:MAG: hypothetical protein KAV87_43200 [Desulfobacteraceae bacterium]|nr:hypothetical protein [Desulfobacteraceae bacterium]
MDFLPVLKTITVVLGIIVLPGVLLVAGLQEKFENALGLGIAWGFGITLYLWTTTAILWRYDFLILLSESVAFWGVSLYVFFQKKGRIKFVRRRFVLEKTLLVLVALLLFLGPFRVLYLPFDTDAQGLGLQALTTRDGGTVDTLTPLYPEIKSLYSPGYFVVTAFISDLTGEDIATAMLTFSHFNAFLIVLLALTVGKILKNELFGLLFGLFFVVGLGLFTALMDAHYTVVLATLILIALLGYLFSTLKRFSWESLCASGFFLGLLVYSHPDTLIAFLIGFVPFWFVAWVALKDFKMKNFVLVVSGISMIGIVFSAPWVLKILPFLWTSEIKPGFLPSLEHWKNLVLYQGGVVAALALAGGLYQFKRLTLIGIFAVVWLVAIIDFSLLGLGSSLLSLLKPNLTRHFYPFGLGWNGAIVPLALLAALFFVESREQKVAPIVRNTLVVIVLSLLAGIAFAPQIINVSKQYCSVPIYGTFSTPADLSAFQWLRGNTKKDALVLNYPGFFGDWVPVLSERRAVKFRSQPWFLFFGTYGYGGDISSGVLPAYYLNPEKEGFYKALKKYGVDYIVVPQILNLTAKRFVPEQSEIFQSRISEGTEPLIWSLPKFQMPLGDFGKLEFLKLVFQENGAQIFRVL